MVYLKLISPINNTVGGIAQPAEPKKEIPLRS